MQDETKQTNSVVLDHIISIYTIADNKPPSAKNNRQIVLAVKY